MDSHGTVRGAHLAKRRAFSNDCYNTKLWPKHLLKWVRIRAGFRLRKAWGTAATPPASGHEAEFHEQHLNTTVA